MLLLITAAILHAGKSGKSAHFIDVCPYVSWPLTQPKIRFSVNSRSFPVIYVIEVKVITDARTGVIHRFICFYH